MARPYHRSSNCKRFVAGKIEQLSTLSFMRVHSDQWTDAQRADFAIWYPGDRAVAEEMLADPRFPAILDRIVASPP